jgi:hypothetical protein
MLATGRNGEFQWLSTETELDSLLHLCPDIVLRKYLAVTSIDSGFFVPSEQSTADGWESRGNIGYSPRIQSIESLPHLGYDEWYVFNEPHDLGQAFNRNIFGQRVKSGQVDVFVNYNFGLHKPELRQMADLFWKQMEWISPESYLADAGDSLTFATQNGRLFDEACRALKSSTV